jgi:LysR family transcriptional regulator, transcriptional activator for dmlA
MLTRIGLEGGVRVTSWRGIEEFLAVVESGSFTAGAEALGVSKSFVSKMVNELETRMGAQLLTRTTRRLSLTAAGELFYDQCRAMQDTLMETERQLGQFQKRPVGRLRIGLSETFGSDFMSSLVAEFSALHPDIIIEATAYLKESEVQQETFDVVIRYGHLEDSTAKARLFGYLSYCLCASPAYIERHGWPEDAQDLVNHNCLADPGGIFHFNGDVRQRVTGNWRSNSGIALRWAARRGLGIAHLPLSLVRSDLLDGKIVASHREWTFYDREVWAVFSPGLMPAATRAFIDYLASRFSHAKARPWMRPLIYSPGDEDPSTVIVHADE